jgi:hypothetical protein
MEQCRMGEAILSFATSMRGVRALRLRVGLMRFPHDGCSLITAWKKYRAGPNKRLQLIVAERLSDKPRWAVEFGAVSRLPLGTE